MALQLYSLTSLFFYQSIYLSDYLTVLFIYIYTYIYLSIFLSIQRKWAVLSLNQEIEVVAHSFNPDKSYISSIMLGTNNQALSICITAYLYINIIHTYMYSYLIYQSIYHLSIYLSSVVLGTINNSMQRV